MSELHFNFSKTAGPVYKILSTPLMANFHSNFCCWCTIV